MSSSSSAALNDYRRTKWCRQIDSIHPARPSGEVVNVDDVARRLEGTHRNMRAARLAIGRITDIFSAAADFNFETTLSSNHALQVMEQARDRGYRVELIYIVLRSAELHIARVHQRVAQGGHDIPVETIRRRYWRSLMNLPKAVRLADQTIIYDNTDTELQTLVRRTRTETLFNGLGEWRSPDGELARAIAAAT